MCVCVCGGNKEESETNRKKGRWVQLSSPVVNRSRAEMMSAGVKHTAYSKCSILAGSLNVTVSVCFSSSLRSCCCVGVCAPTGLHIAPWNCALSGSLHGLEVLTPPTDLVSPSAQLWSSASYWRSFWTFWPLFYGCNKKKKNWPFN